MKLTVAGRIVERIDTGKQVFVVIQDEGGDLISGKFWGRNVGESKGISKGQSCRLSGVLKAREWQGKYYLEFDCDRLVLSDDGMKTPADEPPPLGDDDIPF